MTTYLKYNILFFMMYLISGSEVRKLALDGSVSDLTSEEKSKFKMPAGKEKALLSRGMAIVGQKGQIVRLIDKDYAQHFFPLSMRDYAFAAYNHIRNGSDFPILSVDSHDETRCDFNCLDCLSGAGKNLRKIYPGFNLSLDLYTHILSEISAYSKERGLNHVRFEQSGEGNPDLYPERARILSIAKQRFGMDSVYISSGSQLNEAIISSLVDNAAFVRISFPGIGNRSYALYSRQEQYTFEDSIKRLETLVSEREKSGRSKDLLLGVRVPLRPEHDRMYYDFAKCLKSLGVDVIQIVKILVPEGLNEKDYPLSEQTQEQLRKVAALTDSCFNVNLPNSLDSMYYGRRIEDRSKFPKRCFSSQIQPVLAGNRLYVCTKSEMMYSQQHQLGVFRADPGELSTFMSEDNRQRVCAGLPESCESCCSIYDNLFIKEIQDIALKTSEKLDFMEMIQ